MIMMYVTCPDEATAASISNTLLEEKLIACANLSPMNSMYFWEDKKETSNEYVALLKTSYKNAPYVEHRVEELHPYDVPCIMQWEFTCNFSYEKWLRKNIKER